MRDRNDFSLSGDSESTNADIATNIRAQFNPADGCCSATAKKMSAGQFLSVCIIRARLSPSSYSQLSYAGERGFCYFPLSPLLTL